MSQFNPLVMTMLFGAMTRDKTRRKRMMETMIPLTMMPPGTGAQSMVAGIAVDRQVRRAERDNQELAREAASAIAKALTVQNNVGKLQKADLDRYPRLNKLLTDLKLKDGITQ